MYHIRRRAGVTKRSTRRPLAHSSRFERATATPRREGREKQGQEPCALRRRARTGGLFDFSFFCGTKHCVVGGGVHGGGGICHEVDMTTWEERESENDTDSAESPGGGARDNDGVYVGGYHDTVADLKVLQSTRPRLKKNRFTSAALPLSSSTGTRHAKRTARFYAAQNAHTLTVIHKHDLFKHVILSLCVTIQAVPPFTFIILAIMIDCVIHVKCSTLSGSSTTTFRREDSKDSEDCEDSMESLTLRNCTATYCTAIATSASTATSATPTAPFSALLELLQLHIHHLICIERRLCLDHSQHLVQNSRHVTLGLGIKKHEVNA